MSKKMIMLAAVAGLVFALAPAANAVLYVYEPFDYAVGTDLSTETPLGASWSNVNPSNDIIVTPGKSYTDGIDNLVVAGNYMQYSGNPNLDFDGSLWPASYTTDRGGGDIELGAPGATIWMSYIRKANAIPPDPNYWFEDIDLSGGSGVAVLLGRYYWNQNLEVIYGGGGQTTWPADQEAFILISHASDLAGNTAITMWVNPPLDNEAALATHPAGLVSASNYTTHTFDMFNFRNGGGTAHWMDYDEIRLGTTYDDVTPIPEPATAVLLLIGAPLLALRRRRR